MRKRPARLKKLGFAILLALTALATTGCGESYTIVPSIEGQKAPGTYFIPPKVDILLAIDDTGAMLEARNIIHSQFPDVLKGLENKGWDYHLATIPLTHNRPIDQILASQYDLNWGAQWKPSFPGASPALASQVNPNYFALPAMYGGFDIATSAESGSVEPGFETIRQALQQPALAASGFTRPDALLAIIVIGMGEDTSGYSSCPRPSDGVLEPCSQQQYLDSFQYYKSAFQNARPGRVKFFSMVSTAWQSCLSGVAFKGSRYISMAKQLSGQEAVDICTKPVAASLDAVASQLVVEKKNYRTRYLFIAQDADVNSIKVTKYIGGDVNQTVAIPQDATNGWTYAGYVRDVYAIDSPIALNLATGYAIELHGAAKLLGEDTADVEYKPAGATDSSSK